MRLSRFPGLVAMLAMGISTGMGQTNGPVPQSGPRTAPVNGIRSVNVRPNNANLPYGPRGPAIVGSRPAGMLPNQIQGLSQTNFRSNYLPRTRRPSPRLGAMTARQQTPTDNVEPASGPLPPSEIVRTTLPITDAQRGIKTDDPKPIGEALATRQISEGLETIDTQQIAKNEKVKAVGPDVANGDPNQHKNKRNQQAGKNRYSFSDALGRNWHEWHNRDWWKQNCNTIVFVTGGYYFLDASYWYPAWGYDPLNSYYDYDGPIYTYGNLLPDQVIANVQAALQDGGYYLGAVTGSLSGETRAALVNYQRDQGLIVTGAIDEPTVEALGLY